MHRKNKYYLLGLQGFRSEAGLEDFRSLLFQSSLYDKGAPQLIAIFKSYILYEIMNTHIFTGPTFPVGLPLLKTCRMYLNDPNCTTVENTSHLLTHVKECATTMFHSEFAT